MARPQLEIDGNLVYKFASLGCKTTEIADYFSCSVDTIDRRFAEELKKGRANLKMSLRQWQLDAARNGNASLLIWLGKQMLEQRDETSSTVKIDSEAIQKLSDQDLVVALKEALKGLEKDSSNE